MSTPPTEDRTALSQALALTDTSPQGTPPDSTANRGTLTDDMLDVVALRYLAKRGFSEAEALLAEVEAKLQSKGQGSQILEILNATADEHLTSRDQDDEILSAAIQGRSRLDEEDEETPDEAIQDLERALQYAIQLRCDFAVQTLAALFPVFLSMFTTRCKSGNDSGARSLFAIAKPAFGRFGELLSAARSSSSGRDSSTPTLATAIQECMTACSARIRVIMNALQSLGAGSDPASSKSGGFAQQSFDEAALYLKLVENDEISRWLANPRWYLAIESDCWDALFSYLTVRQCHTVLRLIVSTVSLNLIATSTAHSIKPTEKDLAAHAELAAITASGQEAVLESLAAVKPPPIPSLYPSYVSPAGELQNVYGGKPGVSSLRKMSASLLAGAVESQSAPPGLARTGYIPASTKVGGETVVFPTSVPSSGSAPHASGEAAMKDLRVVSRPPHIVASTLLFESELLSRVPVYWGLLPAVMTEEHAYIRMLNERLKEVEQIRARKLLEFESEMGEVPRPQLEPLQQAPVTNFELEKMLFPAEDQLSTSSSEGKSQQPFGAMSSTPGSNAEEDVDPKLTSAFVVSLKRRVEKLLKQTLRDSAITVEANLAAAAASVSARALALMKDPTDLHAAASAAATAGAEAAATVYKEAQAADPKGGNLLERPKVPTAALQWDRGVMLHILADLRRAVTLSQDRLPDCALITMLNDYGHVITGVTCTPDMSYVVAGLQDSTIRVWHFAPTIAVPMASPTDLQAMRKRPHPGSGESILLTTSSGKVVPFTQRSKLSRVHGMTAPHLGVSVLDEDWPNYVAFDPEAVASNILNILTKSEVPDANKPHFGIAKVRTPGRGRWAPQLTKLVGHAGAVTALAITVDQQLLVSGGADAKLNIWHLATSQLVSSLAGHSGPIWSISVAPLGGYVVTGSQDGTARLWLTDYATSLRVFIGHLGPVRCTAFHPNSSYVATGSDDQTVRIWDMATGACVRLFLGYHRSPVRSVAFSPDGRLLASGGENGSIVMWDLPSGQAIWFVQGGDALYPSPVTTQGDGHIAPVQSVSSYDDSMHSKVMPQVLPAALGAVGSAAAKSFDLAESVTGGAYFARPACPAGTAHVKSITGLSFSSDSAILASSSADGSVKLWRAYAGPAVKYLSPETSSALNAHPLHQRAMQQFYSAVDIFSTSLTSSPNISEVMGGTTETEGHLVPPRMQTLDEASATLQRVLIKTLPTKSTPVWYSAFTPRNLLLAIGVFKAPTVEL